MSDINVTNLLDTAFILVIALMVVAPQLTHGIKLDLPTAEAQPLDNEPEKTIVVSVQAKDSGEGSERVYLDNTRVTIADLYQKIEAERIRRPEMVVQVEADKNASYGAIFEVLDAIKRAGVDNIDLSSQPGGAPDKEPDENEESQPRAGR